MVKTSKIIFCILSIMSCSPFTTGEVKEQKRAMTFLDVLMGNGLFTQFMFLIGKK